MMTFNLRLRKMVEPQFIQLKFDLDRLHDPLVAEQFKATIVGKIDPLLL